MVSFNGSVDRDVQGAYVVWRPNGHVRATLGPTETLENVLIEQDRSNSVQIDARGSDPTVRNVGWKGVTEAKTSPGAAGDAPVFLMRVGGNPTVENVYMTGWGSEVGGMWSFRSHSGHIEVRNSYFAGFGNNSCYLSNHGKNSGRGLGTVDINGCFSHSSTTGNFRISGRGSRARNCVAIADDPNCRRGHYPDNSDAYTARPFTGRHTRDIRFENDMVYENPNDCNGGAVHGSYQAWHCGGCNSEEQTVVNLDNCHINANAPHPTGEILGGRLVGTPGNDLTMSYFEAQGGVPLSPEMAARGERGIPDVPEIPGGDGGTTPDPDPDPDPSPEGTTLAITGTGSRTDYTVTVDGEITGTSGFGQGDEVTRNGTVASGFVRGGTDEITYTGCIASFDWQGPVPSVNRDGEQVAAAQVPDCPEDGDGGGLVGSDADALTLGALYYAFREFSG